MNLYQKINEVKKAVKTLSKDAETTGQRAYSYVSGSQILSMIKDKMEEIGLLFLPVKTESRGWTTFEYKNANGAEKTDFVVEGVVSYEWINIEDPNERQRVDFDYYGQQNDISKAFGSALTYSERYLLLKSLGAPTDEDDPDKMSEDKKGKSTNQNKSRLQSKYSIIQDLIKGSEITGDDVDRWITAKFGSLIKINNLTDEQFELLKGALIRKVNDIE